MNKNNSGAEILYVVCFVLCILFFILAWIAGSGYAVAFYISLAVGLVALLVDNISRKKEASIPEKHPGRPTPQAPPKHGAYYHPASRHEQPGGPMLSPLPPPQQTSHPDTVLAEYYKRKYAEVKPPPSPPSPPPPPPRPKGLINNRYEFIKKLKGGGMAEISLAKDWDNGQKQVVIKRPRNDTDHATKLNVDKLHQEADYLRKTNHPNIVKFIDLFQDADHLPNLVEDYVNGGDLLSKFKFAAADEQTAITWAVQILNALEYIHNSGFIHRDLNPGNIMANQNSDITLIDFGTVKNSGFSSDTVFFKPGFVIPEVAAKGYADTRSDIYGVGGTLYYLLTCDRPGFIKDGDVVTILTAKGISLRTSKCVDQALQLDPNFRFQKAEVMRRALTGG